MQEELELHVNLTEGIKLGVTGNRSYWTPDKAIIAIHLFYLPLRENHNNSALIMPRSVTPVTAKVVFKSITSYCPGLPHLPPRPYSSLQHRGYHSLLP